MSRKRINKDDTEAAKKRVRSFRTRERRTRRTDTPESDPSDFHWIERSKIRMAANRILNDSGDRPYWLSIPKEGVEPVAGFLPCNTFTSDGRVYYGFAFREHRDILCDRWDNARKELTCNVPR